MLAKDHLMKESGGFREFVRGRVSLLSGIAYVSLVLTVTWFAGEGAVAVCLLSFCHYYLYWLAYYFGEVPLDVFKRDAIVMKAVSLIALASVYLEAPLDAASLLVIAAGFLLNSAGARALGPDRTYYGHELAGLPCIGIRTFPYSWMAHPMLLGNMAAFAGTLVNAQFRVQWWPLAVAHIALNVALLIMETSIEPRRRKALKFAKATGGSAGAATLFAVAGAVVGAAYGAWRDEVPVAMLGAFLGAMSASCAFVIFLTYTKPTMRDADHAGGEERA